MPTTIATFLQLLKETTMRSSEAKKLKCIDVDFERRSITLNEPEKGNIPIIFNNLTGKLLGMLNALPRKNSYVFGDYKLQKITCWEAISNQDQAISWCDKCEKAYQKQRELKNGNSLIELLLNREVTISFSRRQEGLGVSQEKPAGEEPCKTASI